MLSQLSSSRWTFGVSRRTCCTCFATHATNILATSSFPELHVSSLAARPWIPDPNGSTVVAQSHCLRGYSFDVAYRFSSSHRARSSASFHIYSTSQHDVVKMVVSRSILSVGAALLLSASSVRAASTSCSLTSKCPESAPCCSRESRPTLLPPPNCPRSSSCFTSHMHMRRPSCGGAVSRHKAHSKAHRENYLNLDISMPVCYADTDTGRLQNMANVESAHTA